MLYIGIDPGASGGIAVIKEDGVVVSAYAMPDSLLDIYEELGEVAYPEYGDTSRAYLEAVHSMPKQGVKSSFTFGESYGALQMALVACWIPFERVTPQKWQKAMGCLSKGDKNVTKRKAQELFPGVKVTHAIADALLIAEYGRRLNER